MLIWDYWPGLQGGSERQARLVSHELIRRGCRCEVITARASWRLPRRDLDQGVVIRRIGLLVPLLLWCRSLLKRFLCTLAGLFGKRAGRGLKGWDSLMFWTALPWVWLARLDFVVEYLLLCRLHHLDTDIVHLHEPSWLGGVAQMGAARGGYRVLCQAATNPALPPIGYDTPFRLCWDRHRRQTHYIAMAGYIADQLVAEGIPWTRIHRLPNGVPTAQTTTAGIGTSNVLYVGNFTQGTAWKAFDVLFKSWVIVARQIPEARLYAVGGGDVTQWRAMLREAGVDDTVAFPGSVQNVEEYFNRCAVFVLPSRVEGMSNALLEAQMCGLACVVSNIPGNAAVVEDGVNGLLVPVNSAESLADAVIELLSNRSLCEKLGFAARKKALSEYSIEKVCGNLLQIYRKVLT